MKTQIIELDCKSGDPRPDDLIDGVIESTGLPSRKVMSRFFGSWIWDYSDIAKDVWEQAKPILEERVKALYRRGLIRFGSWG